MPRRMVQVFGVHGTLELGCQNQRRVSVAPVGVVMVAAPNTFEKTYGSSLYVGYPEIEPVPYSWRGAAIVFHKLPEGAILSTVMAVPISTWTAWSLMVLGTAVPGTVSTPSSTIS